MKNNKLIFIAALFVGICASLSAQQTPNKVQETAASSLSVDSSIDFEGQYWFRGKKVTDAATQPAVNLNYKDFTLGVWSSIPAKSNNNHELDVLANYSKDIGNFTYALGATGYFYPDSNLLHRSYEFNTSLTYNTIFGISPSVTYYHDIILNSNTYQFGLTRSWDLCDKLSLDASVTVGHTQINQIFPARYTYYQGTLDFNYSVNKKTKTFFGIRYTGNNDGTSSDNLRVNSFWLGVGVKFQE